MSTSSFQREMRDLNNEIQQTLHALRQLQGQGAAMAPGAGTRTGYVQGVASGNASLQAGHSSQPGAPLALTALAVGASSSMTRMGSGWTPINPFKDVITQHGIMRSAGSQLMEETRRATSYWQLRDKLAGEIKTLGGTRPYSNVGPNTWLMQGTSVPLRFEERAPYAASSFDPANTTRGSLMGGAWTTLRRGATPGQRWAYGAGESAMNLFSMRRGTFLRQMGSRIGGGIRDSLLAGSGQGRMIGWIGRGMAVRALADSWNQLEAKGGFKKPEDYTREEQMRVAGSAWAALGIQVSMLDQAAAAAAPEIGHMLSMGVYSQAMSGTLMSKGGIGKQAARLTSLYDKIGKRPGHAAMRARVGRAAIAAGAASWAIGMGAGLVVATGLNAMGDVIKGARGLNDPEAFAADEREQSRKVSQLEMMERVRKNLRGRQGVTIEAEKMIRSSANEVVSRSGFQSAFGSDRSLVRKVMSWATFGWVKSEGQIRDAAMDDLEKKDKRIATMKDKAWDNMRRGSFAKAKYYFEQTWEQSPMKGAVAAWKDPQRIYQAVQAARITSRHYAASFQTRNRERTGD